MKRIFILILLLFSLISKSQIINDSVRPYNCFHDGAIFLEIINLPQIITWYYDNDSIGWIEADTINELQFSANLDSVIIQQCGSYKVDIGSTTKYYWIACPLGVRGYHQNIIGCDNDSNGIVKTVAYAGSSPYLYEWYINGVLFSSGQFDTIHNNLVESSYQIIVTDSIGCIDTTIANIYSPPALLIDSTTYNHINCRGVNTGSIRYAISGGKQYASSDQYDCFLIIENDTVSWVTRDSISYNFSSNVSPYEIIFDSLFAGNYIMSIIDSFGCTLNDTFTLIEPDPYETFASTTFPLLCNSDSGYLKIDSVLGGGNILYGFIGPNTDSIYVPSGWYDMYIEDLDFNCIDTVPVRCYAQYEINVFEKINSVLCFGDQSGSIIIDSIIGGNTPYDIQWGGVDNLALSAGVYLLHIVDSIGCVYSEEYIVSEPNQILANEIFYPSSCAGMNYGSISIDVAGGTGELSYYWVNGTGTSDSLYGLSDGVYSLIVTDSITCVDTFSLLLESPQLLDVQLNVIDSMLLCNGASTIASVVILGGTSPYTILWDDGDSSQQRVVGAGLYSVIVQDASGCESVASVLITEPDSLSISMSFIDISCSNGGLASVSVNGGTPPINFLWNTGDTTQTIDSLFGPIYTYFVRVTDDCGALVSDTVYLVDYELITEVYYNDSSHTAQVEVDSLNSSGPFTYEWLNFFEDSIGEGEVSPILCEGTYYVLTTDLSYDCFVVDTVIVEYYLPIGILDIQNTTAHPDSILWGFEPYTYLWDNGEVSTHADICPGPHWLEITDKEGCMIREDFIIEDMIITLDPPSVILECNLENLDFNLEASAIGGVEPYSVEWWNGSTENPINLGMSPGSFSVSVIDDNNCIQDTSFIIASMTAECIPDVFTPNEDGINDTWSLEDTFLYEDSEVRIYGRFGSLVFHSVGYHEQWDGKNEKEKDVPAGVYFYSIEIGHGFDQINGTVTILR
ncbi:MAG: hypothetical protein CMD16_04650 [Flavobacteriales bacterium]|nr:hypothetical protein [Flavobacteriales bacterium]|tara:strand:- start:6634 stop:9522 length:2889 start_codon:yes stop_codon:yes gene_type:complete